ncbi:MAG: hypothetical protein IJT29_02500 [Oscillospiraceae bacterium]|nr:hypothetical protein [Oscillospiraceae bacterium]
MKRLFSLLLVAALLLGLAVPAFAEESFADSVQAQAFALAMAHYDLRYMDTLPDADEFCAEAAGWYGALRWRTEGVDLLTAEEVLDFERSLGYAPARPVPEDWEGNRVRVLRGSDGRLYLDFAEHKLRLDDALGQSVETRLESAGDRAVSLTLIRHFTGDKAASYPFTLRFEENGDAESAFPWKLSESVCPSFGPQLDPSLTFDWDLLLAQNQMSTLLGIYDCVKLENEFAPDMPTWIFRRGDEIVGLTGDGKTYAGGTYRGCSFVREADETGALRTRVSDIDVSFARDDYNEAWLSCWLEDIALLELEEIADGVIRAKGVTEWGYPIELCVDYGTLALREVNFYSEDGARTGGIRADYTAELPDFSFLDVWDEPLRKVTVIRENWEHGAPELSTNVYELPADWEYLPWEGLYGEYTIYMNEGYTESYAYPGDGVDYTLYMTTAKG